MVPEEPVELTVVEVDVLTEPEGVPPDTLDVEIDIGASAAFPNEIPEPPPLLGPPTVCA